MNNGRNMDRLLAAYSGDKASNYDKRRETSSRWKAEVAAMKAMLPKTGATRILDCPFGTGRWATQYLDFGAEVIGIDLSPAMLDEAKTKLEALPVELKSRVTLCEQSAFDLNPSKDEYFPDLIVCIRFLNWIDFHQVKALLGILSDYNTPQMIIGASVVPTGTGLIRRAWYDLSLKLINQRGKRKDGRVQFVHDEGELLALIENLGWSAIETSVIMRRNARVNKFYRLKRHET